MNNDERIVIRIDPELKQEAKRLAAEQNRTLSGLIKHLISEEAKRQG